MLILSTSHRCSGMVFADISHKKLPPICFSLWLLPDSYCFLHSFSYIEAIIALCARLSRVELYFLLKITSIFLQTVNWMNLIINKFWLLLINFLCRKPSSPHFIYMADHHKCFGIFFHYQLIQFHQFPVGYDRQYNWLFILHIPSLCMNKCSSPIQAL